MKKIVFMIVQIAGLFALTYIGEFIADLLHLPIPGTLIGMGLLYLALHLGIVKTEWFAAGADTLIGNLLLFFVPAAVGIMNFTSTFVSDGIWMLAVLAGSMIAVLYSIVALTVWIRKHQKRIKGALKCY